MEHNYPLEECSKSGSSEESDRSDQQANDDMGGTGRSYECVFCKRGFTTAQALGGHMNIHRKDRAKTRPSNSSRSGFPSRNNIDDGYGSYSGCPPMQGYQSYYPTHHEVQYSNNQTSYPVESTWGYRPSYAQNDDDYYAGNSRHYGNQIGEDWGPRNGLSLQLGIGSSDIDDESTRKRDDDDDSEVDLELRLGHQYYRRW